jgi:hypothetical protein
MLAESKKGHSMRWISAGFGAVIENKQILPAGRKFIAVGWQRSQTPIYAFVRRDRCPLH